jgi:hypothetical protein
MYMMMSVVHSVKTGEIISEAGMLTKPMPSKGMSTLR